MWTVDAVGVWCALGYSALAVLARQPGEPPLEAFFLLVAWTGLPVLGLYLHFRRREEPFPLGRLIFWAIAFRICGLAGGPFYEDDFYRYLWDGYRFATTGTPYGAAPEAFFIDPGVAPAMQSVLHGINHPELPTIYAPVTQAIFLLGYWLQPGGVAVLQAILIALDLAAVALLLRLTPARNVLLYAWCPLVIKEIHQGVAPLAGPWDDVCANVAGQDLTLNRMEHGILRPIWRDKRIHYAVNCAAYGCPDLMETAFTAANTESLLEAAARAYVNCPRGVDVVDDDFIVLSGIYKWYPTDIPQQSFVRDPSRRLGAWVVPVRPSRVWAGHAVARRRHRHRQRARVRRTSGGGPEHGCVAAHRSRPQLRLRRRRRRVLAREFAPKRHSQGQPSTTRRLFGSNRAVYPSSSGFIANYRDRIPLPPEVLGSAPSIGARSCLSAIGVCKTTFPRPDRRET